MTAFDDALRVTLRHEGVYSNDVHDAGGETFKGISRVNHPGWPGWDLIDKYDKKSRQFIRNVANDGDLESMVREFYRVYFWDALRLNEIESTKIAIKLFDMAVNIGKKAPIRMLQDALSVYLGLTIEIDGIMGPATVAATNSAADEGIDDVLLVSIRAAQVKHYESLVRSDDSRRRYLKGWVNRAIQ